MSALPRHRVVEDVATFAAEPIEEVAGARAAPRARALDALRGIVMILMALDHVRGYLGDPLRDPTDPTTTTTLLFATRWVTHLCAPAFVLLAGISAFLASRRRTLVETSWVLLKRGLWLVFLEVTVVHLAWAFEWQWRLVYLQVIWVIGLSMIALAGLIHLPRSLVAALGAVILVGHNALDSLRAADLGAGGWLWTILHEQGELALGGWTRVDVYYPLLPWIGLMAIGWACGPLLEAHSAAVRATWSVRIGLVSLAGFVALRATNLYGDPRSWSGGPSVASTLMSFLDVTKYPPSLAFLLATLGVTLLVYAVCERMGSSFDRALSPFGRAPLFYYLVHLHVLHILSLGVLWANGASFSLSHNVFTHGAPGWGLPALYISWAALVALLYLPCKWFAGVKARRTDWWLGYL
jgi:uncharacterized membrane protein